MIPAGVTGRLARERDAKHISNQPMPFTAAHPAAILPLAVRLSVPYGVSALAVGSMSPDFEYFLWRHAASTSGHSIDGLFVFCLPAGLIVLAAFHTLVKRPLALLLPGG